jgi:hypothetical protein
MINRQQAYDCASGISTPQFYRNFAKELDGLNKVKTTIGLDSIRPTLCKNRKGWATGPIFQRFNLEWKNRTLKLFTQAA